MTRIAEKPGYCVSCYGQPDSPYVDFEASYDGAVIPGSPEPMPVEDLVICEACLLEAFNLLDPKGQQEHIDRLDAELDQANTQIKEKDKAIQGLQDAVNSLGDVAIKRGHGRPAPQGVDKQAAELVKALNRAKGRSTGGRKKVKA